MRELTNHKVNGLNEALRIEVLDEPGSGSACHKYRIVYEEPAQAPELQRVGLGSFTVPIEFQNGPIQEAGVNGISNEALLAIVEDRLLGFQSGPFRCPENGAALIRVHEAMMWLRSRTRDRAARGVEGTNQL